MIRYMVKLDVYTKSPSTTKVTVGLSILFNTPTEVLANRWTLRLDIQNCEGKPLVKVSANWQTETKCNTRTWVGNKFSDKV